MAVEQRTIHNLNSDVTDTSNPDSKSPWTSEANNKMRIGPMRGYMYLEVSIDCHERKKPKRERVGGFKGRIVLQVNDWFQ